MQYFMKSRGRQAPTPVALIRRPYPDDHRGDQSFLAPMAWKQTFVLQALTTGRDDANVDEISEDAAREHLARVAPGADVDAILAMPPSAPNRDPLAVPGSAYSVVFAGGARVTPVRESGELAGYAWHAEAGEAGGFSVIPSVNNAHVVASLRWLRALRDEKAAGVPAAEAIARLGSTAADDQRGHFDATNAFRVDSAGELEALNPGLPYDPGPKMSQEALNRKLALEIQQVTDSGLPVDAHALLSGFQDLLGYSYVTADESYVATSNSIMRDMAAKFTPIGIRNSWGSVGCQGIVTWWADPSGQLFETQLHTPSSLRARKALTANFFAEQEVPPTTDLRRAQLDALQNEMFAAEVAQVPGASEITLPKNS